MIYRSSPFKLTTHFRGWSRVLAMSLGISCSLNFALIYANVKQSANFANPRIVMNSPSGMLLPVAASAFVWTPEVARDYVKLFLPVLYTFSSTNPPQANTWLPFIHSRLLKEAGERFQRNQGRIQNEGLSQTLYVREATYDPDLEAAVVSAEVRVIDRTGQITRTPVNLTVELTTTADPLNPYGHLITNVR